MSLRNQPYFPLYVQDYLTDEKLSLCCWETQGVYIKILCILHKQENYGAILFKQNSKQNLSIEKYFASILIKLLPVQIDTMEKCLIELLENNVLKFDGEKLFQKRMYKDGQVSLERSKAAKKGGGNPILKRKNTEILFKQNSKQNHEDENENENINEDEIKKRETNLLNPILEINFKYLKLSEILKTDMLNFWKFNDGNHAGIITQLVYDIDFIIKSGQINLLMHSFYCYKKCKNYISYEYGLQGFVGTEKEKYEDGGWYKTNWVEKLKTEDINEFNKVHNELKKIQKNAELSK